MQFFGAFMLLVLPLFLFVCIQIIRQGEFGKTIIGHILEAIFIVFGISAIVTAFYLLFSL